MYGSKVKKRNPRFNAGLVVFNVNPHWKLWISYPRSVISWLQLMVMKCYCEKWVTKRTVCTQINTNRILECVDSYDGCNFLMLVNAPFWNRSSGVINGCWRGFVVMKKKIAQRRKGWSWSKKQQQCGRRNQWSGSLLVYF